MVKKDKKMGITIKDIITTDNLTESVDNNINVESNRMIVLSKALEQKDVVLKEQNNKPVDSKKIKKEINRFKKIMLKEWQPSNQFSGHIPNVLGQGQTVNTFISGTGAGVSNSLNVNNNPNSNNIHNPNYNYLSDAEALRLSISRALNSGDPTVQKLGFYEEVNQSLNSLGLTVKSPLDIKQMIIKMMKG